MNGAAPIDQTLAEKFHLLAQALSCTWQDQALLNELFRRLLTRTVRARLGRRESEWEDALQTCFLHAWEHRAVAPTNPHAFRYWLFQIARSVCIDLVRRPQGEPEWDRFDRAAAAAGPCTQVHRKEVAERVEAAVADMPERIAEIVRLRLGEELSMDGIAARTGRNAMYVHRRLGEAAEWFRSLVTTRRKRPACRTRTARQAEAAGPTSPAAPGQVA